MNLFFVGSSDTLAAFESVKEQIFTAKVISMKRKDIVTRLELLQSASNEIEWLSSNDNVPSTEDLRFRRAKILIKLFPKMLEDLHAKVILWNHKEKKQFLFDGVGFLFNILTAIIYNVPFLL